MSDSRPNPYDTQTVAAIRDEAIEQCARVADQFVDLTGRSIAAAIRALKNK